VDHLQAQCPSCRSVLQVPRQLIGKQLLCTVCQQVIVVPGSVVPAPLLAPPVEANPFALEPAPLIAPRQVKKPAAPPAARQAAAHGRTSNRKPSTSNKRLWIAVGASSAVVAVLVVVLVVMLGSGGTKSRPAPSSPVAKAKSSKAGAVAASEASSDLAKAIAAIDNPPPPKVEPPPPPPPAAVPGHIDSAAVQRVKKATVYLRVHDDRGPLSEGSGFFAGAPGLVLTNAHVIGMMQPGSPKPAKIDVVMSSGEPDEATLAATVLTSDGSRDLAVLRIEPTDVRLPAPLPIDTAGRLTELQKVYIFGFPFGASLGKNITVNESAVSSLRKDAHGRLTRIQVNGDMNPGNSGGPLVDARGVVIGVAVAHIRGTQISFAVPSDKIEPLLEGQVRDAEIGEAFRAVGGVKLPVRITCLDPLRRIREVKLDVWTGRSGPGRPDSAQAPAAAEGDGPKQTVTLKYQDGVAAAEIDLPKAPPGTALWLQPVLTFDSGSSQWAAVEPFVPSDEPSLVREAVTFKLNPAAPAERTLLIKGTTETRLHKGAEQFVDIETVEVTALEAVKQEPRGVAVQLHPGELRSTVEQDGLPVRLSPEAPRTISSMYFSFLVSPEGAFQERGQPSALGKLPFAVRREAVDIYNRIALCYEATGLTLPSRAVQPLETWTARVPLMVVPERSLSRMDLHLNCTYEGRRQTQGKNVAFVRLSGEVRGREANNQADGKVIGHALVDLDGGYVAGAELRIASEFGAGEVLVRKSFSIQVTREAGNPRMLTRLTVPAAAPPPKLPDGLGKVILNVSRALSADDPRLLELPKGLFHEHTVTFRAGAVYVIEMTSPDFRRVDPFLRLEGPQGALLADDDDSGGELNARIIHRAAAPGRHTVIATTFDPRQTGAYTLRVTEFLGAKKP